MRKASGNFELFTTKIYCRSDAEVQKSTNNRDAHETKSLVIAFSGFLLSVFFIVWALIVLVRFYIFDNILYNIFLMCMLMTGNGLSDGICFLLSIFMFTGFVFNIASINLMLTDVTEFSFIFPFVIGSPVSIFWTILCIFLPIFKRNFYTQFAFMPIAVYDATFYDGLGYDPNNTAIHPFAKRFMSANSFFDKTTLILMIFVISASRKKIGDGEHFNQAFVFFQLRNWFSGCIRSSFITSWSKKLRRWKRMKQQIQSHCNEKFARQVRSWTIQVSANKYLKRINFQFSFILSSKTFF